MHLSCILMHMTLEEVMVGATINAAAALGKADKYGSIEPGKFGNLLIINASRLGSPTISCCVYHVVFTVH